MSGGSPRAEVRLSGRTLSLSNLDKVLWPQTGFTKGDLIDYYARIAGAMVPHLEARPVTLRRWPDGVGAASFFQKNCPAHRPGWIGTVAMGGVEYCRIDEPAALVWAANLASIEIHPGLARAPRLDAPAAAVLDLDPGAPADVLTCARVALLLAGYLERLGLRAWPKTSGSKGLQLYLPLNRGLGYGEVKAFVHALARLVEREHPDLVVSVMDPSRRRGKVMIDWSQNTASKTTVAVYSVRALDRPSVSTPLTWDEVDDAISGGGEQLRFSPAEVVDRVAGRGDVHRPVLEVEQELPALRT